MTDGQRSPVARYLRRVLSRPGCGGLSDAELLERFVAQRDEAAFEVLVWRHGPAVLGVCRRVLRHEEDAEDAFQATFLVLVRKAGAIGRRQAVGSWLYRVAYRVALRAKAGAAKRSALPTAALDVPADERVPDWVWGDLRPVLDDEVNRLPEKYRAPFVLCYLDGLTNEEAARELGCPKGTVLSRLAWARERLRARLARRGLAPSAGLLGTALAADAAAAVPAALVEATLQTGMRMAAGEAVVGGPVAALAEGVLRTMLWNKVQIVTGCVLAVAVLTVGGGLLTRSTLGAKATASLPAAVAEAPADEPDKTTPKPPEKRYAFEVRDKPWASVLEWLSDQTGLPFNSTHRPAGTFTLIAPRGGKTYTLPQIIDILNEALVQQKLLLVRREASFTLVSIDKGIDSAFVPRVRPEDLDKRGKTELVTVVLSLTKLKALEVGPEIAKISVRSGRP
jgi:RNA polymerase sigma factor (sigma-70 family)